ncbi:MAG: LCP family protein, partial [Solirubrobacterales bacterium]|nr:LCP family protein [Solirubrobacterales bacterium]
SMASATAITALVYLTDIAKGLGDSGALASLRGQLEGVDGGAPQTILILGSDKRSNTPGDPGRSDTTILLRVDPDKGAISLLSIPRDLRVQVPGYEGDRKFNEAYALGGPDLTLEVVKQLTGEPVNHVVNIDFLGFADAVNSIDCVYIDVDRRYLIPPESGYAEIDIEAGYQRLCGLKALQYVRYRQTDDDLVRSARQQDFLREARQKVPPSKLISDRNELLKVFTDYTTSDINDPVTLLEFIKTLVRVGDVPVNEVQFPAVYGEEGTGFVEASDEAIEEAVDEFLAQDVPPPPSGGSGGGDDQKGGDGDKPDEPSAPEMIDSTSMGQATADLVDDKKLKIPVYFPTLLTPESVLNDDARSFPIDGPGDDAYRGYKMVAAFTGPRGFPEYYGISGTNWQEPPILANPSEVRTIEGRDYMLFYDGDRLRLVGFRTSEGTYWVNNTLTQNLGEDQMLAIATGLKERE